MSSDTPDSLFQQLAAHAGDRLPPVHLWQPKDVKDIGMRVTRDGTWWYQGSPIRRERMVRMFSRVLRREGSEYFLVTPVEKVRLDVEAAPLLAVRMESRNGEAGSEIAFATNVGDIVVADADHPIRVRGTPDAPLPMVTVRDDIEALLVRSVFYELVEAAQSVHRDGVDVLVVTSRGREFQLGATQ